MIAFICVFTLILMISHVDAKRPEGGANCTLNSVSTDCGGVGHEVCEMDQCLCTPEYTDIDCSYQRKSQVTAFLLGFFLGGFGADMFYLELEERAIPKLVFFLLGWIILPIVCCILYCWADAVSDTASPEDASVEKGLPMGDTISLPTRDTLPTENTSQWKDYFSCGSLLVIIIITTLMIIGSLIWVIIDWAMIAANKITDGQGESMYINM